MKKAAFIFSTIFAALTLTMLTTLVPTTATAQSPISGQLEVTRAYSPKVGQASKIAIAPDMTDTVRLRPEGDYSITPTAWQSTFPTKKFAPASMGTASYRKHSPLYIRAGLGYPLESTFDLYYTPYMGGGSELGVFVNHTGSYSKIINDIGIKSDAVKTLNGVGLFGYMRVGRRYTLEGDLSYDNRYYQFYGSGDDLSTEDMNAISLLPISRRTFNDFSADTYNRHNDTYSLGRVGGTVSFGDTFTDLSRLNFRVGIGAGFSHTNAQGNQIDADLFARVAQMPHKNHGFEVSLSERGAIDVPDAASSALAVTLAPRYLLSLGKLSAKAGFDARYIRNGAHNQHYWHFAPALEAQLNVGDGAFVPFVSLSTRLADGSYEALSRRNPYLHLRHEGPSGTVTDLRAGFSGKVNDIFTYKLTGGVSWLRNYQIFVAEYDVGLTPDGTGTGTYRADYSPVMFSPAGVRGVLYTVGGEVALLPIKGFSATLFANYNRLDLRGDVPGDLPDYDAGLSLSYSYKGIFTISAGAHLIGDRSFLNRYDIVPPAGSPGAAVIHQTSYTRLKPVVDVSLTGEVRVMDDFWVFVEGGNLANQGLYSYNHYRGGGANVMAGIKVVF